MVRNAALLVGLERSQGTAAGRGGSARLEAAIGIVEAAASAPDAHAQTRAFACAAAPQGVTYPEARVCRRPAGASDPHDHWKAGGVLGRVAPGPWE